MQLTIEIPDELAESIDSHRDRVAALIRHAFGSSKPSTSPAVEEVCAFLASRPAPKDIIAYRPSKESVERLRELLDQNREQSLNGRGGAELDTLQSLNHLFALVKLQAREQLEAAK